jgi:hypothetical protein
LPPGTGLARNHGTQINPSRRTRWKGNINTMNTTAATIVTITLLSAALAGCDGAGPSTSAPSTPSSASTSSAPSLASSPAPVANSSAASTPDPGQAWLGRWRGPEGTYLQLDATGSASYAVRIKDLDAERTFQGVGKDGVVHFERDGKQESIKATDGDATGMKWLAGKTTCLTVHPGEGYCRD